MKTIQINNYAESNKADLIKALYDKILRNDSKFHFLYEPQLIIRVDSAECLGQIKMHLKDNKIDFEEYDYPNAPDDKFGETKGGIVEQNPDLFIPILHFGSLAALKLPEKDYKDYLDRAIHSLINQLGYDHEKEGKWLHKYSKGILQIVGINDCPND